MNIVETGVFFVYLIAMVAVGVVFFIRSKGDGEKEYFLGGRQVGPWVAALSAGASDMSAWVLMGLPTAIYLNGLSEVWIAIGLGIGYALSWILWRRACVRSQSSAATPSRFRSIFRSVF